MCSLALTAIVAIPSNNLFLVMESNSTILSKSNIIKNMNNFAEICSVQSKYIS